MSAARAVDYVPMNEASRVLFTARIVPLCASHNGVVNINRNLLLLRLLLVTDSRRMSVNFQLSIETVANM